MKKLILIFFASLFLAFPSPTHAVLSGNYFGDGSDGAVTINSNTNLTVPNKSGSYDGDMVVKNYTTLTVNEGTTLTTDQPGRGLLIYVQGNAVINGTISMSARGAYANPTIAGASDNSAVSSTGLRLPILKSGWTNTLAAADFAGAGTAAVTAVANQSGISNNGKIYTIVRQGASGGSGRASASGLPGASGSTGQSGGGGGGGGTNSSGGNGSYGSSFGGGSGGGGSVNGAGGGSAITWGGAGGNGNSGPYCTGSGAGNPAGAYGAPQNGTGGTVILIVGGNLTIGSAGKIEANGKNGGTANFCSWGSGGGGATGGGVIVTLYAGSYTNNGTIQASGGTGGGSNYYSYPGGNGGAGSTVVEQIDASYDDSCQPSLTDSTHTITASCSFTNTIDGLDTGTESTNTSTLTVQSGTLTINNGYKVAAGSFVVTNTGSIAIADGGQFMAGYPIWLVDADADGYPVSSTHYPQFSAPTNGRRRNLLTSITTDDCDDTNASSNLSCVGGTGTDGSVTISASKNINTDIITAGRSYADGIAYKIDASTATGTNLTTNNTPNGIVAGDEVLLINLQGWNSDYADVGNYEFLSISSVDGTTINFSTSIQNSYDGATASNQKVVVQRVPQYADITINSGQTLTASDWDSLTTTPTGTAGYYTGIVAFKSTGTTTITGNINVNGKGYRGGAAPTSAASRALGGEAYCGDNDGTSPDGGDSGSKYNGGASNTGLCGGGGGGGGYSVYAATTGTSIGGGGGGGGAASYYAGGGGGGGYGTGGSGGVRSGITGGASSGNGGAAITCGADTCGGGGGGGGYYGNANLTTLFLGSAGASGGAGSNNDGGSGGDGGGIVIIEASTITISGTISSSGNNGGNAQQYPDCGGDGGGGAGGSIKLIGTTMVLGTTKVVSTGGTGTGNQYCYDGGTGGTGRIVVDSDSITGTTSPTYTNP